MAEIDRLKELSIPERVQLVEDLWDTVFLDASGLPLSRAQTEELDRRLDRLEGDPGEGVSWSMLRDRIRANL
jgi:putative addiction module component (TIGR02574 family)